VTAVDGKPMVQLVPGTYRRARSSGSTVFVHRTSSDGVF
jgi:hypothetical protein